MKALLKIAALTALIATPLVSFAQTNQPLTRAEVRANLANLEQVGYRPQGDRNDYPAAIQSAELRVSGQTSASLTRAQVKTQLAQLEKVGYKPNDGFRHPDEAIRAEQIAAEQNAGETAYGSTANGTAQAGN